MSGKLGQYSQCDDLITATLSHNSAMPPTLLRSFFSTLLLITSDVLATGVKIYENGIFYFYSCYYKMERFMDFMMTHVLHCMMRIFTLLHGPSLGNLLDLISTGEAWPRPRGNLWRDMRRWVETGDGEWRVGWRIGGNWIILAGFRLVSQID